MNRLFRHPKTKSTILLSVCAWYVAVANVSPSFSQNPPVLISHSDSTRAIAFDSVTFVKEPFVLFNRFSSDHRTRVMVFALNVPVTPGVESELLANVETENQQRHNLPVEKVFTVSSLPWLTGIIVKLSDSVAGSGLVNRWDNFTVFNVP